MTVDGEPVLQPWPVGLYARVHSEDELRAACAKATADERERCARLADARHDELADHARQARALPQTSARLDSQADALRQFADLIRQQP
jgi:hypothetical protein